MASESDSTHMTDGQASGSMPAQPRRSSLTGQTRQEFRDFHIADSSRAHIGNVYNNNTYNNADQSNHNDKEAKDPLMDALEFTGMRDRLFTVTPACADTCSWFLQTKEYTRWRDPASQADHNGVLWIKGKAGTGKSTLMRYIHDQALATSNACVTIAFFFNGRSPDALVKSTEGMYRSLLHQLYNTFPRLKEAAAQRISIAKPHTWSLGILEDLFREAVLGLTPSEDVVCYIDALDECDTDEVRLAVEYFEDLSLVATSRGKSFLLCLSSRYYPHITMRVHIESKLDAAPQHWKDIEEYLDNRLTLPSVLKLELKDEILGRCSGVFLWVVLVTRMLKESFDAGAVRQDLHEQLSSLPRELQALFTKISQSADARFAVAMRWVLFANGPLDPEQLYFAIRSDVGDLISAYWDKAEISLDTIERYLLHASRGLTELIPSEWSGDSKVQFVHESVREYLLSGSLARLICVSERDLVAKSHLRMVEECHIYLELCLHGKQSMLEFKQDHEMYDIKDSDLGRKFRQAYPFGRYAAFTVFVHVERAYRAGPATFNHPQFSVENCIEVQQFLEHYPLIPAVYVPGHSANLLTQLIECGCTALPEYLLRSTGWSKGRTKKAMELYNSRATAWTPSELDLSTCCGGHYGSPIQAAVAVGNLHLVQLLLNKGASLTPYREEGQDLFRTPLMTAMDHANKDMTQLLLKNGASVNCPEPSDGLRPLHAVFTHYRRENFTLSEKIKLLLSYGASVNLLPCTGVNAEWERSTAILIAASRFDQFGPSRDIAPLRALLEAGADVNAVNADDHTPLIIAASSAKFEAAKLLLEHGANAEYRSASSGTAVAAASPLILLPLLYVIRLRALKGRDGFLQLAPQLTMSNRQKPSKIPAPTRPHSQRAVRPLQYRHSPRCRRLHYEDFGDCYLTNRTARRAS